MEYSRSSRRSTDLLLFVARRPTPGETKTRLGRTIGMERAAALYEAFLVDLSARFTPGRAGVAYDFGWAHSPAEVDFPAILRGLGCQEPPSTVRFVPQQGEGLAARLSNLFQWAGDQGYRRTVIMATDSPHLPYSVATDAFAALDGHQVVLGRTADGGYYLIGLTGVHDVLAGAPLSTGQEADALVATSRGLGLAVAEICPSFDVDEAADLERLHAELAPDGRDAPATWSALRRLGLVHTSPLPRG